MDPTPFALLAKGAYHLPHDIDIGSFRARVDDSPLGNCLSIAGTDDIQTAITDIEALLPFRAPEIDSIVPASFWAAAKGAEAEILAIEHRRPLTVVGGHSLGGVLAIYTAALLCLAGRGPLWVFAFAPPRACVGDGMASLFASYGVTLQLYRLGGDEVPELPPGYNHPAALIQLGRVESLLHELDDHAIDHIIAALGERVPA